MAHTASPEPIAHVVILDTGAIIRNEPPIATLLKSFEQIVTVPAVLKEIQDATTRARFDTLMRPFVSLRTPAANSVQFVTSFARRTGDLAVLSPTDIAIIALAYEIECEKNQGDWRLRSVPGQKRINGRPPVPHPEPATDDQSEEQRTSVRTNNPVVSSCEPSDSSSLYAAIAMESASVSGPTELRESRPPITTHTQAHKESLLNESHSSHCAQNTSTAEMLGDNTGKMEGRPEVILNTTPQSDGWITPSNLQQKQAQDCNQVSAGSTSATMQVAILTTDFAMQNVILQVNLNLLSPSLARVKHVKTFVLRCHACFQVTKDMMKRFCPKCGQATLTRVACSTNANGEFQIHLKKNMQWNTRGDKYTIPKPVHGSANGRVQGGGKNGWGNELILTEDQKEFQRATTEEKRMKSRALMDDDFLPNILTGHRPQHGGPIRVGGGRNINSKRR